MKRNPLLPIFLIVVVDILGLTIMLPLLPFYAEHFGASARTVGLLVSSYAACQLVAGPALGAMSDRVGRRPLLIVSQIGTFIGFLILANARWLWMVFLARVIDGLTAGNLSLAQAYIADVTEPKDRAKSFAVIGIGFGIGFLFGPALSGYLAQYGLAVPIYAAAGMSFTSIMATTFLLPKASTVTRAAEGEADGPGGRRLSLLQWGRYVGYFKRPVLGLLLALFFLFVFSFSTFSSGFALFAERRLVWHGHFFGPKETGYVFAYAGFLGIILQGGLIGRLVRRFGEQRLVQWGFFCMASGYVVLAFAHDLRLLIPAATLSAFGNGALRPALTALITQNVARTEQGVVLGLNQSLQSIASIGAPALAGALIDHRWLSTWALVAGVVALAGMIGSLRRVPSVV